MKPFFPCHRVKRSAIALAYLALLAFASAACSAPVAEGEKPAASVPASQGEKRASSAQLIEQIARLAEQVESGDRESAEPQLLALREQHPREPEILVQLARVEYLRAVAGLGNREGEPPSGWDRQQMDHAEQLAGEAVAMDPNHANGWVVMGQIRWVRGDFDESLKLLERAEAIDPRSVKLRLRKGTTLRSLAWYRGDKALIRQAVLEFEKVIDGPVDDGNERLAASKLGAALSALEDFEKAERYLTLALQTSEGSEKAMLLHGRSLIRRDAGKADGALSDSGDALAIMDFGAGRYFHAEMLLVKAGLLVRDGQQAQAAALFEQARQLDVDLAEVARGLGHGRTTYPAIYGLKDGGLVSGFGDDLAGDMFGEGAWAMSAQDVQRLISLGVNADYVDRDYGTALHRAVAADNVAVVEALLARGANTDIRHPDGRTLLEQTLVGTSPERRQVRRLVLAKVGRPAGWKEPNVDLPVPDTWYRVGSRLGAADHGAILEPGEIVQAGGVCRFTNRTDLCLTFYRAPGRKMATVSVPLSDLDALGKLKPVSAPQAAEPEAGQ